MIKTVIPNVSVDEVIQTIKQEVLNRKNTHQDVCKMSDIFVMNQKKQQSKVYQFAKKVAKYLHRKGLYRFVALVQKNLNLHQNNYVYELGDFTKFYDEEFIENAYKLILLRAADQDGKNHYLSQLRSGRLSKTEIIVFLHFSKEGRAQNVIILGIRKRYILALFYKIPLVGYIAKTFFTMLTIPKLIARINSQENLFYMQLKTKASNEALSNSQQGIELQLQHQTKASNDTLLNFQKNIELQLQTKASNEEVSNLLAQKANIDELEQYLKTVKYAKEYMKTTERNMQNLIDEAKKRLPDAVLNQTTLLAITEEEKHKFDALYVEFEDKFRGSRENIKARVEVYLPYINRLPFTKEQIEILDIGCGRAEWLELLSDNGYKAKGIDLNQIMVSISKELNLDVEQADVLQYLKSLKSESLSVITGFHIIEHLPFEVLITLFEESLRVLKKEGMVIFETPNPENILVGARYFYTDPTHINPLVPATMQFLAEYNGFKEVEIKRLRKYSDFNAIDVDSEFIKNNFSNEMDYAVIGYKK